MNPATLQTQSYRFIDVDPTQASKHHHPVIKAMAHTARLNLMRSEGMPMKCTGCNSVHQINRNWALGLSMACDTFTAYTMCPQCAASYTQREKASRYVATHVRDMAESKVAQ